MQVKTTLNSIFQLLIIVGLGLQGCTYFKTDNVDAAYLQVDAVGFNQNLAPSITDQRIEDVYVYADGKLLGGYQVPFRIPIIDFNKKKISLLAGIYADGIREARVQYPFFASVDSTFQWEAGKTYTMNPTFNYVSYISTPLHFSENFERTSSKLDTFESEGAKIKIALHPDNSFPAGESSYLEVYSDSSLAVLLQSASNDVLPAFNRNTSYLEFEYQSNTDMIVGLLVKTPGSDQWIPSYDLYVRPVATWKKVYCTLDDEIASAVSGSKFKVFFRAAHNGTGKTYYRLDNVRVMTIN